MAKAFSLVSWNVEHFKNSQSRVDRVVAFLSAQNPDVFALYEVEGKTVFDELASKMPNYTCHITEGPQVQEILVGVKRNRTAFFTQKVAFKAGNPSLRPGALLTLTIDGQHYPILFLHTKSGDDPKGLGLRDDMLVRACDFMKVLADADTSPGPVNYMFLGDLNTMGMEYTYYRDRDITAEQEIIKLKRKAQRRHMKWLGKTHPHTWSNGSGSSTPDSNLDHVVAAEHLEFRKFGGADVRLRGWPELPGGPQRDRWIRQYSDHALLFLEVQKA